MTDKKQEMVSHMSVDELEQLIAKLEFDLIELEDIRNILAKKYSEAGALKRKLLEKRHKLLHKLEIYNNDRLLKNANEKRELLIERLKRQGIVLTSELEDFICGESKNLTINEGVITLSETLANYEWLPEILSGTGAVLFARTITLPSKKCSKLLSDVVDNSVEIEFHRQKLGYYEVSKELDGTTQEYALATEEERQSAGQLGYYETIIAEKKTLLDYCTNAVQSYGKSPEVNRQKSIGTIPASSSSKSDK